MTSFLGHYCTFEHLVEGWDNSPPIKVHHFDSMQDGPHLLVMSGIHAGTEAIPTAASETAINMLNSGMIKLTHGELTIIPLCNPLALIQSKRYVDENLNRVFKKHDKPTAYEHAVANILCNYVDRATTVVDLHTQSTPTIPFVFNDFPDTCTDLSLAVGIRTIIEGWPALFEKSGVFNEGDSTSYAATHGIPAIVAECGYNKDPLAAHVALQVIIRALDFLKMSGDIYPAPRGHTIIQAYETITMPNNGALATPFKNFDLAEKGDALIIDKNNGKELITALEDCIILLPKTWAEPGMEAMFLGK